MKALNHHRSITEFLIGGALGLLLFLGIYGFAVLDPSNIGWCLMENNDTGQHFIGGWAFLRDVWRWPPGLFYGLSHPDPASISIIDGIPIAALIVKSFRGARPEPFQYLGWWGLVSFFLQGGFAALLMRKIARSFFFRLAGVFFLVVSVPFLTRYPIHTALASHFLILWALYLMLCKWNMRTAAAWTVLLTLSLAVHPYLTAMCLALYLGVTLQELVRRVRRKEFPAVGRILINYAVTLISALLTSYLLGFFSIGVKGGGCLGQTQINLNSLVNPVEREVSAFVAPMPCRPFVENIYLGLGLFLLIVVSLPKWRRFFRRDSALWCHYGIPAAMLLMMVLFAVNCHVCLGNMTVVQFLPPQWLEDLGRVFQSAGRFAWPAWYMLAALTVGMVGRGRSGSRRWRVVFIAAAVSLQIFDIGRGLVVSKWAHNFALQEKEYVSPYAGIQVPAGTKRICYSFDDRDFCDVGNFALKHGLVLEDFYFARSFRRTPGESGMEKLLNTGKIEVDCIYLLTSGERAQMEALHPSLKDRIISVPDGRSVLIGGE